jgi:hypothetical protein
MILKNIFFGIYLIILSCSNNIMVPEKIKDAPITERIVLQEFPENNQLYSRNEDNIATILIKGTAEDSIDSISVKVYKSNGVIARTTLKVQSDFSLEVKIEALLHDYTIELFAKTKTGEEALIEKANRVTAGDVFVVHGQSNAWAIDYDNQYNQQDLPSSSKWVRTIGAMHVYNSAAIKPAAENTDWFLASGKAPDIRNNGPKIGLGMVGVLGMRLGIDLVEAQKIPIAIINGAGGGGAISFYQKTFNTDLNVPYGRLQNRIEASGLKNNIKAFIWNQGENNAGDTTVDYKNALVQLYNSFKSDFTFEKFYVIQTPPGCTSSSGHQTIREAQRQFVEEIANTRILTRHGFSPNPNLSSGNYFLSDGCHYHAHGYEILANWISNLAKFDFYGQTTSYEAPKLIEIQLESSNSILLTFNKEVHIQTQQIINGIIYTAKDYLFAINNNPTPASLLEEVNGNSKKIRATFTNQNLTTTDALTYILGDNYPNTSTPYQGPWIVDANTKVGAVGFTKKITDE